MSPKKSIGASFSIFCLSWLDLGGQRKGKGVRKRVDFSPFLFVWFCGYKVGEDRGFTPPSSLYDD
jgi:hypothetical protein